MATSALRIIVAVNPTASWGHRRDAGPRVIEALRLAGHTVTGLSEPTVESLRRAVTVAIATGTDVLVVVGGDGMVSLGVNALAGTRLPLGIVPSGTGNDLARGLKIPVDDTDAAIRHLLEALSRPARAIDAVAVQRAGATTWYAGVLSAGFDAAVNERANHLKWPQGPRKYTLAILLELAVFKPISYRLVVDGVMRETRAMLIAVANNVSLGGGMRVAPDALLDDGLLDLFIVTPMSRLRLLWVFPKVFSGTHTSLPQVELTRCRSVSIEASGVVAYADGERIGALPVLVTVVPGALLVHA